jgi:hypothetical protein
LDQGRFVAAHDDAGVGAADEGTAVTILRAFRPELGHSAYPYKDQFNRY